MNKPRNTTTLVGQTTVFWDSMGDPYRFERDGVEVPCVCDPATGAVCGLHKRDPDAPYREV
jgi:hypothetical protein